MLLGSCNEIMTVEHVDREDKQKLKAGEGGSAGFISGREGQERGQRRAESQTPQRASELWGIENLEHLRISFHSVTYSSRAFFVLFT